MGGNMKPRWTVRSERMLSEEQLPKLIKHLEDRRDLAISRGNDDASIRDYYIMLGLLESGIRVTEFCNLKLGDFQESQLNVRCGLTEHRRPVLLSLDGIQLFQEWLLVRKRLGGRMHPDAPLFESRLGGRYTRQGLGKRISAAFSACGFPAVLTAHSLRHTNCKLLLQAGASIAFVRDNLGHASVEVVDQYIQHCHNSKELRAHLDSVITHMGHRTIAYTNVYIHSSDHMTAREKLKGSGSK